MNDLKFAFRQLLKNPGFTVVAVLTLALCIGANTAIFSVVDKLLVRALPVPEPQQLTLLGQRHDDRVGVDYNFNFPLFRDYQGGNTVFSQLAATMEVSVGLGTGGETEPQRGLAVSGNYFAMLRVNAEIGRTFAWNQSTENDDATTIVLSHGLWQRRFGSDPQVIGREVSINGQPFTVIGVTPRGFTGTASGMIPDFYLPISKQAPGLSAGSVLTSRTDVWFNLMGRLKDATTLPQAQAAMSLLSRQIYGTAPLNTSTNLVLLPGGRGFSFTLGETRVPLNLLMGAAGLVLLLACANLANLQLARAMARTRGFAVRLALGASRLQVIRELLTESLLLAMLGGGVGLIAAKLIADALRRSLLSWATIEIGGGLDWRVLMFALGASLVIGIIFGLAPALHASRPELVPELKGVSGTTKGLIGGRSFRGALVVLQVAVSVLVLVSAGLCVRSLKKLQRLEPGFEPSRVALMSFDLGMNNYTPTRAKDFYDRLLERVRAFPGVQSASLSANTPLSGGGWRTGTGRIEGYQRGPNEDDHQMANIVASDYFRTVGVRVISGRDFNSGDTADNVKTMIVNDAFARLYWPGQEAVGKRTFRDGRDGPPTIVVGVVETTPYGSLADSPEPVMYFPLGNRGNMALTLDVRTSVDSPMIISELRALVKTFDAAVPVLSVQTLAQKKNGSLALQSMTAWLLSSFGLLALLLAALGIYGVLAYSVSRRTREIGVRMALGAQVTDVLRLILQQGFGLTGVGLLLGLGGAFAATRLLRGFLYETQPFDPVTFFAVALLLVSVAAGACWLPARRAAQVDPMEALRTE